MILYLDTSALVKLYVEEDGSDRVRRYMEQAKLAATSRIAQLEARSAFARKRRDRSLTEEGHRRLVDSFIEDWKNFVVVECSETICTLAVVLIERYPLRTLDSVHLASALFLKQETNATIGWACSDQRLNDAAAGEGLASCVIS